jgi:hypothetical protein
LVAILAHLALLLEPFHIKLEPDDPYMGAVLTVTFP